MNVAQIYPLVNTALTEVLGEANVLQEDLSNLVDMGKLVIDNDQVDNYVRSINNVVGKDVFNDRKYSGYGISVLKDSWEYGSIMRKFECEIPEAVENPAWNLQSGQEYSDNIFNAPEISVKMFNSKTTFEVDMSYTDIQIKESFNNASAAASFITMIRNKCIQALDVALENLIQRTVNNFMAGKLISNNGIVDLLALYNDRYPDDDPLDAKSALLSIKFHKFATYTIGLYVGRIKRLSTLFNVGGKVRHTPYDSLHCIFLDEFVESNKMYLEADTFNKEVVNLPKYETTPYWQGVTASGVDDYDFDVTSSFNIKNELGEVDAKYVIGVFFDDYALGVTNENQRVKTAIAQRGEFYNNFYKEDASYFNDLNENGIVFVLGLNSSTITPADNNG